MDQNSDGGPGCRPLLQLPEEQTVTIVEIEHFFDHFRRVGVDKLPDLAALPRNYEKARNVDEWVFDSSFLDMKEVGRLIGLNISVFGVARPVIIQKNEACTISPLCIISSTLLEQSEESAKLLELLKLLAPRLISNRTRPFSSEATLHAQLIVTNSSHAARLEYEGVSEHFPKKMLQTMHDLVSSESWKSDPTSFGTEYLENTINAQKNNNIFRSKYFPNIFNILLNR